MLAFKSIPAYLADILMIGFGTQAEKHSITFENKCNRGTPKLIQGPKILHSGGGTYHHQGPLISAIAYLQVDDKCGFNADHCTMLETTLKNPDPGQPGSGSSTDVSLIPPHKFNVAVGFKYSAGHCGGNRCASADCCPEHAFCKDNDYQSQRQCQVNNVDLVVTFC